MAENAPDFRDLLRRLDNLEDDVRILRADMSDHSEVQSRIEATLTIFSASIRRFEDQSRPVWQTILTAVGLAITIGAAFLAPIVWISTDNYGRLNQVEQREREHLEKASYVWGEGAALNRMSEQEIKRLSEWIKEIDHKPPPPTDQP